MVERAVTGAHYGLRDWLAQRVTALFMALCGMALAGWLLLQPILDYDAWTGLFAAQPVRAVTLLFLLSVFYHAWIGVRNVVMDYVRPYRARLAIHVLAILVLLLYAIWAAQIIWGM